MANIYEPYEPISTVLNLLLYHCVGNVKEGSIKTVISFYLYYYL
jgi:hypothetical protein